MPENDLLSLIVQSGIKVLISVIILLVTFRIVNAISMQLERRMEKKKLDKTLTVALLYAGRLIVKVLVVAAIIGYLGFDTGGISALLASLGVGIGLAVNGTLSNFAGGITLLVTRPIRIDDFIEAQGYSGTVLDIRMITTKLKTPDGKIVFIPNGSLSSGAIVNYSLSELRRVDIDFPLAYRTDFRKAQAILLRLADECEGVKKDPAPAVRLTAENESTVTLTARLFVNTADYFAVRFDFIEAAKAAFDAENIAFPYPTLDVHIEKEAEK